MEDLSGHMQSEDDTVRLDEQRDRLLAPGVGRVQTGSSTEDAQADTRSAGSVASTREKDAADDAFPSRRLKRFPLVVYLAFAYAVVALFAWSIICVLVYRPVTTRHYGLWLPDSEAYPSAGTYAANERWLQAARVLQAIVTVLTLPLTSVVCSSAAVAYVQRSCSNGRVTLRQTAVLADNGWTSLEVLGHLLRGRGKQFGSGLLYLAMALHVLGALISPLQSVFTSASTVQTPGDRRELNGLTSFADRLRNEQEGVYVPNNDAIAAAALRAAMIETAAMAPQTRLWNASGALNCSIGSSACAFGQASLINMSALEQPFVAQLPAGFSTGLVRQFLPRLNSSVSRERITDADFPTHCSNSSTFFANFSSSDFGDGSSPDLSWHLVACMPGNQTQRPLDPPEVRHDFTEDLYLNLSARDASASGPPDDWSGLFKISVATTSGYFELPNYMNGMTPGLLLSDDPKNHCGHNCTGQGISAQTPYKARRSSVQSNRSAILPDIAYSAIALQDKGPLLTTALALFGPGSFIADRVLHPNEYIGAAQDSATYALACVDLNPFLALLSTAYTGSYGGVSSTSQTLIPCIRNTEPSFSSLQEEVLNYVQTFVGRSSTIYTTANSSPEEYDERLKNAFEAAAFLANQQWLTSTTGGSLSVIYDAGLPTEVPRISDVAIVLVSILLAIFLAGLLATALYSNRTPRWTNRLDSLAMMQFGAAVADRLPLVVIEDSRPVKVLDETPGWIGDEGGEHDGIGQLRLGARPPLRPRRRYRCFEHDHEKSPVRQPGRPYSRIAPPVR